MEHVNNSESERGGGFLVSGGAVKGKQMTLGLRRGFQTWLL